MLARLRLMPKRCAQ
ncbi:hypothetical protein ACO4HB_005054 [Escherichia coli]